MHTLHQLQPEPTFPPNPISRFYLFLHIILCLTVLVCTSVSMSDVELQLCLALPAPNNHHGLHHLKRTSCLGDKGYGVKNKRGSEQTSGNLNNHECNAIPLLLWSDHPNKEDAEHKDKKKRTFAIDDMNGAEDHVVGWPPIKLWRKRTLHHHHHHHQLKKAAQIGNGNHGRSIYVKVKVEGVPIARKIDLRHYHSYHELTNSLIAMFTQNKTRGEDDYNTRYTLTYQDNEGDWLIAGDIPWQSFVRSVQRLKILINWG